MYKRQKDNVLIQDNYQEESHFIDGYVFKDVNHSQTTVSYTHLEEEKRAMDVIIETLNELKIAHIE